MNVDQNLKTHYYVGSQLGRVMLKRDAKLTMALMPLFIGASASRWPVRTTAHLPRH